MQLGLSELNIRLSAKPTGKSRVAHESPTEPLQSQAVVLTTNNSATAFTIRVNRPSESTYKGKAKRAVPGVAASRAWFTVYLSLGSRVSRSPSPRRLSPRTVSVMAKPGARANKGSIAR